MLKQVGSSLPGHAMRSLPQILVNFHWIVPGEAARAAQIHSALLGPFLAANRIAAMINLRGHHPEFGWWRRETRVCRARDIRHFDAMLDSRLLPSAGMLRALLAAFDAAPRPFLIKCSGGQDRTSFAGALYLLHRSGWSAQTQALSQLSRFPYLHFPKQQQHWLRVFPTYAEQAAEGRTLGEWVIDGYDPKAFKAWLDGKGFKGAYRGLYPA